MADELTTQNLPVSPPVPPPPRVAQANLRPYPVPSLAYSTPGAGNRPGLLTAIGVMSIVIACFSAVASLILGFQALGMYFVVSGAAMAGARPPAPVVAAQTAPSQAAPATAPTAGPGTRPATGPTSAPASAGTTLTPAEIQTVIQKVQARSGNGLNPAQVATLQAALQNPAQDLVTPGTAWSPVVTVNVQGGNAFVHLSGGWLQIDPQGQVISQFSTVNPLANFKIPLAAIALVGVDAVASILLAVLLLVAGILVFRRSALSRRLHRIYAWTKIPVALAGAAGIGWMYSSLVGGFTPRTGQGQSAATAVFWMWGAGSLALALAYPVGLLIALRSKQVRAYYNSISG